ncbi:arylsulfatase B-like [Strongylocentrotus purpuratus]|uniref:Sulfatase N-terminal domain-containing protein n=1 Tax=Strongylocentrotus purpuratus TaxID=7668 RepID=A0A7M7PEW4_STRPU|nr:arylsulfatase B-like [Strongylocentrotus purpuratus]
MAVRHLGEFVVIVCLTLLTSGSSYAEQLPNVVFILADDYGFNDVGYHGRSHGSAILTPNLDMLAGEGVKLENYYVQPICSPTRSQLMSGRYQIHTGLQHGVIRPPQPNCLPLDEVTLPQKLKENGYATNMVGKWHIGFYLDACLPTERGFDSYFGYLIGAEDYYTHMRSYNVGSKTLSGYDLHANKTPVFQYEGQYSTHLFTNKTIDVIERHDKTKPLFMYLAYQAVHVPLEVPDSYMDPYMNITDKNRRTFAGMVACMDEGVGNITRALKDAGLYDNTIIIFSTDNGGPIQSGANNWPLRGSKGSLWEGGIHGVGFVHSPLLPTSVKGTVNRELIHVSDWLPTIVAGIAGGALNGTKPLDGYNVWSSISGTASSPRKEILHNIDSLYVAPEILPNYFDGEDFLWRFLERVLEDKFDTSIRAALRVGDWKIKTGPDASASDVWQPPAESGLHTIYPIEKPNQKVLLFNITADPLERTDLSGKYPDVVDELLQRLEEYYKGSVPVRYPDPDLEADPALHGGSWGPWE